MKLLAIKIVLGLALLLVIFAAHVFDKRAAVAASYTQGKNDALITYLKTDIKTLTTVITQTQALVDRADAISKTLEHAIAQRQTADQKTTQEFYRALSRTAASRANCKFDDDVMQQLAAARDRANRAAGSGIIDTMPPDTGTE